MRNNILLPLVILLCLHFPSISQDSISAEVEKYVSHPRGSYLLQNLTLVDGTGQPARRNQDILINGEYIAEIGQDLDIPENTRVIDMNGRSAMPGMVMLHEHLFYPKSTPEANYGVDQMSFSFPKLYLAGGVTSMRTGGSIMPQADVSIKQWIDEGRIIGPKMDVTSPHMDRVGVPIMEMFNFDSPEEAVRQVNFYADLGMTSIKVYNFLTREDLKAIVDAAHARNMKVTGHLCSITYREAADIGIDNIEHGFGSCPDFVENKVADQCYPFMVPGLLASDPGSEEVTGLIRHLIENNVAMTTTINVWEPYTGREIVPGGGLVALAPTAKHMVYQRWASMQGKDSVAIAQFNKLKLLDKQFHDAGGLLVAGTDPTYDGRIVAGYANMRLLEIFIEMGFTLPEAVMICTYNGARYLDLDETIGTLEKGKLADIVIMKEDITKNVSAIRSEKIVFKNGIGYNSRALFEAVKGYVGIR